MVSTPSSMRRGARPHPTSCHSSRVLIRSISAGLDFLKGATCYRETGSPLSRTLLSGGGSG
jgi:hypothetical protein